MRFPTDPRTECEGLLSLVVSFAAHMLCEQGSFHPFGAAIATNGEYVSVEPHAGDGLDPAVDDIRLVKEGCVKGAREGRYRATAVTYKASLTRHDTGETESVVAVSVDHRDGFSALLLLPHTLEGGVLALGDATIEDGAHDIFSSRPLS